MSKDIVFSLRKLIENGTIDSNTPAGHVTDLVRCLQKGPAWNEGVGVSHSEEDSHYFGKTMDYLLDIIGGDGIPDSVRNAAGAVMRKVREESEKIGF